MSIENELYSVVEKAQKYDELVKIQGIFNTLCCSFCGTTQDKVNILIAGRNVYICNECVPVCVEIIEENKKEKLGKEELDEQEK